MSRGGLRRRLPGRTLVLALLVFAAGLAGGSTSSLAGELVNQTFFGGVAIKGFDPVAYFTLGKAVEGSEAFSHEWLGATWHFASAEHRDLLAGKPAAYAPQYGGYCAQAVSEGRTAKIDPEAWHIVDGRLYLLYSKDARKSWRRDIPSRVAEADTNWPVIKADLTE